ncbi:MAG TPA: hypothetical protein VD996_11120, partial [Chitinophagaceae bacterium]|nr:hypothetical protein [Chitinophagaceae bacterium]
LLSSLYAIAQKHTVTFTVVDETRKPLSYASIVFVSREAGAMTNNRGLVSLTAASIDDTVKISAISYRSRIIPVRDLQANDTIVLHRDQAILDSVVVIGLPKETSHVTLGYFREKNNGSFILRSGAQLAVFMQNPDRLRGRLKKIQFRLEKLTACNTPLRIRVLAAGNNATPGRDLLLENIILNSAQLKKFNTVDLSKYEVPFTGNGVFIVMEWLDPPAGCPNPKTPVITANLSLDANLVWFNFRDRKWEKRRSGPSRNDRFMTPNVSVEVGY